MRTVHSLLLLPVLPSWVRPLWPQEWLWNSMQWRDYKKKRKSKRNLRILQLVGAELLKTQVLGLSNASCRASAPSADELARGTSGWPPAVSAAEEWVALGWKDENQINRLSLSLSPSLPSLPPQPSPLPSPRQWRPPLRDASLLRGFLCSLVSQVNTCMGQNKGGAGSGFLFEGNQSHHHFSTPLIFFKKWNHLLYLLSSKLSPWNR